MIFVKDQGVHVLNADCAALCANAEAAKSLVKPILSTIENVMAYSIWKHLLKLVE